MIFKAMKNKQGTRRVISLLLITFLLLPIISEALKAQELTKPSLALKAANSMASTNDEKEATDSPAEATDSLTAAADSPTKVTDSQAANSATLTTQTTLSAEAPKEQLELPKVTASPKLTESALSTEATSEEKSQTATSKMQAHHLNDAAIALTEDAKLVEAEELSPIQKQALFSSLPEIKEALNATLPDAADGNKIDELKIKWLTPDDFTDNDDNLLSVKWDSATKQIG